MMQSVWFRNCFRWLFCRRGYLLLALFFCCGAACGVYVALGSENSILSLMRMAMVSHVSIVGLTVSTFLPFLIAAFAAYAGQPVLLYVLGFLRMFGFTFLGCCIHMTFGSAGWLLRWLFQFTDSCALALFCWFCLRQVGRSPCFPIRDLAVCATACSAVSILDHFMISPFLAGLF